MLCWQPGVRKFSRHERPMGGRKDKEKREKALEDQRAVSTNSFNCNCLTWCFAGFSYWCNNY